MAINSSTSAMQSVTQLGWRQFKLQQARRNADQAERTAQLLQQQAAAAQGAAARADEDARSLFVQADQAQAYAVRARQGVASLASEATMQSQLTNVIDQATHRQQISQPATPVQSKPAPVVNTQGQTTGKIINTTA